MAIPTLYKWDDAGAPQLTRQAQSLLTILRKCLVEGYGSKAALGWSIAFDDAVNQRTVYRNASGKGEIRFAPASTPTGDNVAFAAASSFADIDTALAPGLFDLALTYWTYEYNRWSIIGTGDALYLLMWNSSLTVSNSASQTRQQTYFFGNLISPIADDPHPFVAIGRASPAPTNTTPPPAHTVGAVLSTRLASSFSSSQVQGSTYISGSISGAASRRPVNILTPIWIAADSATAKLYQPSNPLLVPAMPALLIELATPSTPPADKDGEPIIRGIVPGITALGFWLDCLHGSLIDVGGTPHIALQTTLGIGSALLISLGEWQS
ncbi:MAG: hypothetical protein II007_04420 [Gammaproteobacteria bacterium]|nr:hypothetical protein [Gammaproteobacteria bacterium]